MTTTTKTKSTDLLLIFAASLIMAVSVQHLSMPQYIPTSKIEEGEVVAKNETKVLTTRKGINN